MNKKTYTTPFTDIITLTDICQSYTGSVFKGEGNPTGKEEGEQIGGIGWGGSNDDGDEADAREMHFSLWDD